MIEGTMVELEAKTIAENWNDDSEMPGLAKAVKSGKWWMVVIGGRQLPHSDIVETENNLLG